ncbi:hypothetical protein QRQ56_04845 [Bradyrhizobium sp. U531]|uniref:YadA-like family protein n=1 Tax=Bradyrhizobium sp. U531 TaxID=3053458 RepID=UPI003F441EA1
MSGAQFFLKRVHLGKIAGVAALMGGLWTSLPPGPAMAQFVCAGSATGSIPVSGSGSSSANQHDVACGISSVAQGAAVGTSGGASAYGFGAFALGANTTSVGSFSGAASPAAGVTSIGANANAIGAPAGVYSTAIGAGADPNTGNNVQSTGAYSVAIGGGDGVGAIAAKSSGALSVAIGGSSNASGANSTAVGAGAQAAFANSAAIGNGATATAVNQVAVGTATNTYKMAGLTSAASTAAQTGTTSFVTTDAAGNLAATSFSPANFQNQINSLSSQILDNRIEARTGTAVALAAGSMPALLPGRKFALSAGYGNFQGANAFAIGATALLYDSKNYAIVGNVGGGVGLERSVAGGRGAVSLQW